MKLETLSLSASLAVLIGAVHTYLLLWSWAYIGAYTPLPHWLVSRGIMGTSFLGTLFAADFLTNIVLCVPAAFLLCRLSPPKLWAYVLAALLPGLIWQYRLALEDITLFQHWKIFLPGALLAIFPLPVTALVIRRFIADSPNRSLGSAELRGPA